MGDVFPYAHFLITAMILFCKAENFEIYSFFHSLTSFNIKIKKEDLAYLYVQTFIPK